MGQYHIVVNLDKRQYLDPLKFGDGLKLMEWGNSAEGTATALAVLLACDNGRGGGDLMSDHPLIGSWAGDRIVVAGDYGDKGKWGVPADCNLYEYAQKHFEDISDKIRRVIAKAEGARHRMSRNQRFVSGDDVFRITRALKTKPVASEYSSGAVVMTFPNGVQVEMRRNYKTGKAEVNVLVFREQLSTQDMTVEEVAKRIEQIIAEPYIPAVE